MTHFTWILSLSRSMASWCLSKALLGRWFVAVLPGESAAGTHSTDSLLFLHGFAELPHTQVAAHLKPASRQTHPRNFPLFLLQVFLHWQVCSKSLQTLCLLHTYWEILPKSMELTTREPSRSSFLVTRCFDVNPLYDLLETRNSLSVLQQHHYPRYLSSH